MHFYHDALGSGRNGRQSHRGHEFAPAGGMARVDENRQVRDALDVRHGREVQRVAGRVVEAAYAALAQDDLVVAFREDVLGRHEELFDGCGRAAL